VTTIIVHYKTSDFLRLGLHVALRGPTLKWMALAVAVAVFATNVYQTKDPGNTSRSGMPCRGSPVDQ
jgi:hypothetical protein